MAFMVVACSASWSWQRPLHLVALHLHGLHGGGLLGELVVARLQLVVQLGALVVVEHGLHARDERALLLLQLVVRLTQTAHLLLEARRAALPGVLRHPLLLGSREHVL